MFEISSLFIPLGSFLWIEGVKGANGQTGKSSVFIVRRISRTNESAVCIYLCIGWGES